MSENSTTKSNGNWRFWTLEKKARFLERLRANRLIRDNAIPFCPHTPTERQRLFLKLDCEEALYGGAAGGAKTDALLMAALEYVAEPGYSAIIFRRTYAD